MNNFLCQIQVAYDHLFDNKPATITTFRNTMAARATEAQVKAKGINDMALFFKHQLFLAGIKDSLSDRVLEAGKADFQESLKFARELEAIHNDRKCSQKIAALKAVMQPQEATAIFWDELETEDIDQIAAVCRQQPFRSSNQTQARSSGPAHSNGPRNPNIVCRYCKKKGHMQRECNSRCRNGAPMVDANGKKYEQRVNNVAETEEKSDEKAEQEYKDAHVGAVANLSPYHHLNW